jgi:hypothetical protein
MYSYLVEKGVHIKSIFLTGSAGKRGLKKDLLVWSMFVERKVCYSALFTDLVGWYAGAVSFPLSDVILA